MDSFIFMKLNGDSIWSGPKYDKKRFTEKYHCHTLEYDEYYLHLITKTIQFLGDMKDSKGDKK